MSLFISCEEIKNVSSDFTDNWGKEEIDFWLKYIGLSNFVAEFELHNIRDGLKLKSIDEKYINLHFASFSSSDRKILNEELSKLFNKSLKIQFSGVWLAFQKDPSKTLFIISIYNYAPRITYLMLYYLDPILLSDILKSDLTEFSFMMLICPEIIVSYRILYNYTADHPIITIVFCLQSLVLLYFQSKYLKTGESNKTANFNNCISILLPQIVPKSYAYMLIYVYTIQGIIVIIIAICILSAVDNIRENSSNKSKYY